MAKLYFKYGAMGSSKTAQALITKFNYLERGMSVRLIKPALDTRDGKKILSSRIGLSSECDEISEGDSILKLYHENPTDVIIADESQFFTKRQIDEMRTIVNEYNVPILCFGLRTDFKTKLFEGSKRLFEIADSITEIKTICDCGRKATVNARIDKDGNVVTEGEKFLLAVTTHILLCATNVIPTKSGGEKNEHFRNLIKMRPHPTHTNGNLGEY